MLFQYKMINEYFWNQLILSALYCAKPNELNDPFDCSIDWNTALTKAISNKNIIEYHRQILEKIYEGFKAYNPCLNVGVSCFTNNCESPLMWSHYADSHRGVCLAYDLEIENIYQEYPSSSDFFLMGGASVQYGENSFSDWLLNGKLNEPIKDNPVGNAAIKIYTSKSQAWHYEEEFRLVTNKEGLIKIPPSSLKQVTFGLKISQQNKSSIKKIARMHNPDVIFSNVMKSTEDDMGLNIIDD